MRWLTHQAGGALAGLLLQFSLPAIFLGICASILPDVIDQKRAALGKTAKQRQKIFNATHRGATHWFGGWLGLFLACGLITAPLLRELLAAVALGGLSHIALDMLTPRGVPILPISRKASVSLRLCSTGSWQEYLVMTGLVIACLILIAARYDLPAQLQTLFR